MSVQKSNETSQMTFLTQHIVEIFFDSSLNFRWHMCRLSIVAIMKDSFNFYSLRGQINIVLCELWTCVVYKIVEIYSANGSSLWVPILPERRTLVVTSAIDDT